MVEPIKRFLLFGGCVYYPGGGWGDFLGSFDTIEQARAHEQAHERPSYQGDWWWHIVDLTTGVEIEGG